MCVILYQRIVSQWSYQQQMFHFFVLFYGPVYVGPCRNCCGEEGLWGETVQPLGVGAGSPALVLGGHHLLSQVKVGLLCPWSCGPGFSNTHYCFLLSSEKADVVFLENLSLSLRPQPDCQGQPRVKSSESKQGVDRSQGIWSKSLVRLRSTQSWVMRLV